MKIIQWIPLIALTSSLFSQNYFANHGDICMVKTSCPNEKNVITRLQTLLGGDRSLQHKLNVTGQFDKDTFDAVVTFQKKHHILPTDGWVGKDTKVKLDEVYGNSNIVLKKTLAKVQKKSREKKKLLIPLKINNEPAEKEKWTP